MGKPAYIFVVEENDDKSGNYDNYYFLDGKKAVEKFDVLSTQAELNGKKEGKGYSLFLYSERYESFYESNKDFISDSLESNDSRYVEQDLLEILREAREED